MRQRVSIRPLFAFLLILLATSLSLFGQGFFGSLVGTITDPSGSAITNAAVTLTNTGTSETKSMSTDANGNYQFVNLVPGTYKVDVEISGFKHLTRENIPVQVNQAARVDGTMEVGDLTQTVEVSSQAALLQTESATVNQVVEGRQVEDIPLNGRNIMNLLALAPGVVPQGSTAGSPLGNQNGGTNVWGFGNYQIGGGIANQNITYLDGAPLTLPPNNATSLVPSQDSISAFEVATNNVSPEFGSFSGGVINMTTKSGTNSFHGNAYEFFRNRALNANDFFNNRAGAAKPPFSQNQFGASLNGPIVKKRTFFSFVWEGFTQRNGKATTTTVPTAAQKAGDFTGFATIYDPLTTCGPSTSPSCATVTRQPFSGNIIPASRISPTSQAEFFFWGAPNQPGLNNNWVGNAPIGGNTHQYTGRIDHSISDKQRIFGRYTIWHLQNIPNQSDVFGNKTGGALPIIQTQQAIFGDTYALNPTTIFDFRVAYVRMYYSDFAESLGADMSQFGPAYAVLGNEESFHVYPSATITGGGVLTSTGGTTNGPAYRTAGGLEQLTRENDWSYVGSVTKIFGRHTIKAGGDIRRDLWAFISQTNGNGAFSYDSTFTSATATNSATSGAGFASFLLGYPTTAQITTANTVYQQLNNWAFYVNDTFQASSKLTINLGLRFEQPGAFSEKHDNNSVWLSAAPDPLSKATGLNLVGQPVLVNSSQYPDRQEMALSIFPLNPRLGIAYRLNNKTVLRTGYGLTRLPYSLQQSGPNVSAVNLATTNMVTTLDGGLTPAGRNTNPYPNGLIEPAGRTPGFLSTLEGATIIVPVPYQKQPYNQQWNFNIQRELAGASIQLGYVGAKGTSIPFIVANTGTVGNQISDQYLSLGTSLLDKVTNPFYGVIPASAGLLGQPTVLRGALLNPYPQFQRIYFPNQNRGMSTYHAFQASFQRRFKGGGIFSINYTWGKFISDTDTATNYLEGARPGATQDWNNLNANKSLVGNDVPHRVVANYVYDLPFGKGQKYLSGNKAVSAVVGGWTVNGIATFQSGYPLSLTSASNQLVTNFNVVTIRPNVVSGCDASISGSAQSRLNQWFNTSCFTQPGSLAFGNESRTDPVLKAAGIANYDFAANRKFSITERINLNFRAEFFNLFNRVQFAAPATQVGGANYGVVTAAANQPRLIQLALRLAF